MCVYMCIYINKYKNKKYKYIYIHNYIYISLFFVIFLYKCTKAKAIGDWKMTKKTHPPTMQPVLRQLEMSTPKFQHLKRVEAGQEMREGERGIYI